MVAGFKGAVERKWEAMRRARMTGPVRLVFISAVMAVVDGVPLFWGMLDRNDSGLKLRYCWIPTLIITESMFGNFANISERFWGSASRS